VRRRDLLLAALASTVAGSWASADEPFERLRAGSLVILLRHAQTVPGAGDPAGFRLGDCSTQRNLSEEGRDQARRIGEKLRAEHVPVGRVLTSAWCRCRDTAELLNLGPAEHLQPLDSFFEERSLRDRHRTGMLEFISAWRNTGNAVLVTHQVNITAVSGVFPASGEVVVMTAGEQPRVVGRLRL
jgi:phosphohistidine phosphatase SixA